MFANTTPCLFCFQTILMFTLAAIGQSATATSSLETPGDCSFHIEAPSVKKTSYIGWPVSLNCDVLEPQMVEVLREEGQNSFYASDDDDYGAHEIQAVCEIWDMKRTELLFTHSFDAFLHNYIPDYQLPDLQLNHTLKYGIMIRIPSYNTCVSALLDIHPISLPNLTCEEAVRQANITSRRVQVARSVLLQCEVPMSANPKLSMGQHTPTTHKWLRNCAELPERIIPAHGFLNAIRILNATYQHPGVYTCAVMHNNQIWYTNHYRLCVDPPTFTHQHSVTCKTSTKFVTLGQKVEVHCESFVSFRRNSLRFQIQWRKANATRCENRINRFGRSRAKMSEDSKVKCSYDFQPLPCFAHIPTQDEIDNSQYQQILMTLTIENVEESDLGGYVVSLSHSDSVSAQAAFTLNLDQASSLTPVYIAIGTLGGVMTVVFITLIVYFSYQRRKRCGLRRKQSIEDSSSTIADTV